MIGTLLGMRLTLWLGPVIAAPAPAPIVEALSSAEVTLTDEGRDGFQMTFTVGRGIADALDYPLVAHPLLRPFSRVIVQVMVGAVPEVLIDGFITRRQLSPSNEPGASRLTVTGEDVRVMMDMHEVALPYPQMSPDVRVQLILAKYATYLGAPPVVVPPATSDIPVITERIPVQSGTDLAYVQRLAQDAGYVFYVEPTPAPMVNIAYWGPENRLSIPQGALSMNVGPETNVDSLSFSYDGLGPTTVLGVIQEKIAGMFLPVVTVMSTRPPLSTMPATLAQQPNVRTVLAHDSGALDVTQAYARAQAVTDRSSDAVSAEGEVDALRYGRLLRARRLVGVRGAGYLHDGFYYVKRVTHRIKNGEYKQSFSLVREGLGAISPVVMP